MLCKKVLPMLSDFFDEVLDPDTAVQVSQHLNQCIQCRKELDGLSALHIKLRSMSRVQAPEYLHHLVQHRINNIHHDSWRMRLQNETERRWSQIRTTEAIWYLTKAMGTVMTFAFFLLISGALSPLYIEVSIPGSERNVQLAQNVLQKLGLLSAPLYTYKSKPAINYKSKPAINEEYFVNFGQSVTQGKDDSFSVVTAVDRSGTAKIQNVLQYPDDQNLLSNFNEMISSARFRPASENGEAVPSHLVIMFSKVMVYD